MLGGMSRTFALTRLALLGCLILPAACATSRAGSSPEEAPRRVKTSSLSGGRGRLLAGHEPPRRFALVPAESVGPYRQSETEAMGVRLNLYANPDGQHAVIQLLTKAGIGNEGIDVRVM